MTTPPLSTAWVPLWPLTPSIPAVQNGKWIKGVGGAMVWSDITYADISGTPPAATLPARLGTVAATISDWNNVIDNGWYMGSNVANAPDSNWYIGQVFSHDSNQYFTQRVLCFVLPSAPWWERRKIGGTWYPWIAQDVKPVHADGTTPASAAITIPIAGKWNIHFGFHATGQGSVQLTKNGAGLARYAQTGTSGAGNVNPVGSFANEIRVQCAANDAITLTLSGTGDDYFITATYAGP